MSKNIIARYRKYREEHTETFRNLLKAITEQVLLLTEKIPEADCIEVFEKLSERCMLDVKGKTDCRTQELTGWSCSFMDGIQRGDTYPADAISVTDRKALDEFITKYYPGIRMMNIYTLDLDDNTIEFAFTFDVEFEYEDFKNYGYNGKLFLKTEVKKDMENIIKIFNQDIGAVVHRTITNEDWDELNKYCFYDSELDRYQESDAYYTGTIYIKVPIE